MMETQNEGWDKRGRGKLMARGHSMEHMRNKNEALAIRAMEESLPEMKDLCVCSMCTEDIFAMALNSLPANYQHSMSIAFHKKVSYKEIRAAVREAGEKVLKKPKHT